MPPPRLEALRDVRIVERGFWMSQCTGIEPVTLCFASPFPQPTRRCSEREPAVQPGREIEGHRRLAPVADLCVSRLKHIRTTFVCRISLHLTDATTARCRRVRVTLGGLRPTKTP